MTRFMRNAIAMKDLSYSRCFLLYVVIFFAMFVQICGGNQVIAPVRQGQLVGLQTPETSHQPENGKFSDYVTYAIPEATVFLDSARSSWIATWMPYNELGRPTLHLSDLSPAYILNWILSKLTNDAFIYVTAISVVAMFLAGAFTFLLARELELLPAAALAAALGIGLSPSLIYWATFPMFACAYGWTAAALYGLARLIRRRDLLAWATIAFAVYSLLMTAYPVMVVYHVYLAAGFLIYLARRRRRFPHDGRKLSMLLAGLGSAVAFGILAALPALVDTFVTTLHSARIQTDVSFLRAAIQPLQSAADWSKFLAFWTFPQLMGNPISQTFPAQFIGRSLAPFAVFLVCASDLRRTWGWWLATLALVAADAFPPVFAFAATHMGLGLSRSVPTVHVIIPLTMIAATNLDSALRCRGRSVTSSGQRARFTSLPFAIATLVYLVLLANAAKAASLLGVPIDKWTCAALVAYQPALLLAMRFRLAGVIIAIAMMHLFIFDRHLLLIQQRDAIVQSTPVTQRLQMLLGKNERFATLSSASNFMPPNMNAQMKLSSVHTYDSLSPLRYQTLIRRLGGDVADYGRSNRSIDVGSLFTTDFRLANIGALITRQPIESTAVVLDGSFGGLLVYKVFERWGAYMKFDLHSIEFNGDSARVIDAAAVEKQAATIISDYGDRVDLRLAHASSSPTLLVASRSFNPDWHAEAHFHDGWRPLRTLAVNTAYEGMVIPPRVDSIRMQFKPWVRWSWLGHVAFGLLALSLAYTCYGKRFRQRGRLANS